MQLADYPWWITLFAVLGMLATVSVIVSLFTTFGRRPSDIWVSRAPEVGSDDFMAGISGTVNAPLLKGGSAKLLNNGSEIFPAMLKAFEEAQHTINFMAYIWEPGKVSDRILEVLCRKAKEGVEVRVMLDGMGGMRAPDEGIKRLTDAGGEVTWFRQLRPGKLTRFHKRNHRRAIIVDGKVGFTGGAAVGDKWLGDAGDEEEWRDMMVEVRGCVASNLQSAFTQLWSSVCGEILLGPTIYPPDDVAAEAEEGSGESLSRHVNVISSPADEAHPLRKFFFISFRCAREKLYLTSPYFVPDDDTRKVIAERAKKGVDVRILLPDDHTDAKPIRLASHSYFQPLLDAGVRIYEYGGTMIHAKALVVDGRWSVMGSANMDVRSKELNQENVIGILDEGFARDVERTFLEDLEKAKEITAEEWRRRGVWARIKERFWVLFAEQY
ncbi:MAG TPA: phospholipase D-like domain-containing protein [Longimicrobiaceae bacterium]|nr:phospholipase D-like domain-containing protein [Longimicrobiaceae bacterium]